MVRRVMKLTHGQLSMAADTATSLADGFYGVQPIR
jgi:hypothetical protein